MHTLCFLEPVTSKETVFHLKDGQIDKNLACSV